MGAQKDQRFGCDCGAEVVYTKDCPAPWERDAPRCVCGRDLRALAQETGDTYPPAAGTESETVTGVAGGQKFLCECGSKVKYTQVSSETTRAPFTCVCGATGTETRDRD